MNSIHIINWAWRTSKGIFDGPSVRRVASRVDFTRKALIERANIGPFVEPRPGSELAADLALRPEIVGAIVWPYICHRWSASTRIRTLLGHYEGIEVLRPQFTFSAADSFDLLDLGDLLAGLRIVVDKPKWFIREGQLVINLFSFQDRTFSLAFSLGTEGGQRVAYIGAIQGVHREGVLEAYKEFTKVLYGMRPRDFLIEVFKMLVQSIGVVKILAVRDSSRHHRSAYFSEGKKEALRVNYDEVWIERGGVLDGEDFYSLPIFSSLKDPDQVPSKKRAMYRRRYDLLNTLMERLRASISGRWPAGKQPAMSTSGTNAGPPPSDEVFASGEQPGVQPREQP